MKERNRFIRSLRVRAYVREHRKQVSPEFITALDLKIERLIDHAIVNARQFKRLKASELI